MWRESEGASTKNTVNTTPATVPGRRRRIRRRGEASLAAAPREDTNHPSSSSSPPSSLLVFSSGGGERASALVLVLAGSCALLVHLLSPLLASGARVSSSRFPLTPTTFITPHHHQYHRSCRRSSSSVPLVTGGEEEGDSSSSSRRRRRRRNRGGGVCYLSSSSSGGESSSSIDLLGLGLGGGGGGGRREGVFIPSTGSLFIPGWDPQAEMEGLGTYFCSGVKNRTAEERATVTLKIAVDRNGAVDDRQLRPARFTCDASLDAVHRLRRDSEAVVVGVETVIRDDPSLTVRRVPLRPDQRQPIRVVLDRRLRIPYTSALLNDRNRTLIYYVQGPWLHMRAADIMLAKFGAPVLIDCIYEEALPPGEPAPVREVLGRLYDMGVREHVMVEGGPATARLFLQDRCIDRAVVYRAPMEFSGEPVPSNITAQTLTDYKSGGVDEVECWSRPDLPWPTTQLHDWP